jgi:hypothetical protein
MERAILAMIKPITNGIICKVSGAAIPGGSGSRGRHGDDIPADLRAGETIRRHD